MEDRFCNQCLEDLKYDDAMEEMHESIESMKKRACISKFSLYCSSIFGGY